MIDRSITFLGAGNMASAMIRGLLRAGTPKDRVTATDRLPEKLAALEKEHGIRTGLDNLRAVREADVVVLSVKPQILDGLLEEIATAVDHTKLVISVAAGVPIAAIERRLGAGARVVRSMPNTPCLVGLGATALSAGAHATAGDLALATALFKSVGVAAVVDEHLLDAVTGLSGSGPAYVFLIIEALSDAGVKVGLSRDVSLSLAAQTVLGSARLLLETGSHPGQLKDQVTSPGGTTIAGLYALEAGGLRAALIDAVEAAARRARQLGDSFLEKP